MQGLGKEVIESLISVLIVLIQGVQFSKLTPLALLCICRTCPDQSTRAGRNNIGRPMSGHVCVYRLIVLQILLSFLPAETTSLSFSHKYILQFPVVVIFLRQRVCVVCKKIW